MREPQLLDQDRRAAVQHVAAGVAERLNAVAPSRKHRQGTPMDLTLSGLLIFIGAALLMVLSPGPNMIYLVSRTLCQGRQAGLISLLGVIAGFICHMLAAAAGLSSLFLA